MKTLGIIGGLSWVSTQHYYAYLNTAFQAKYGGENSAPLLVASVNFEPVVRAQLRGDWESACGILVEAAHSLKRAGADRFLIASNTMHLAYERICQEVDLPGINIFDAIVDEIKRHSPSATRAAFLGTRYAMDMPFFADEYRRRGLEIDLPDQRQRKRVNEIIFKELIRNQISEKARTDLAQILASFPHHAPTILGCTELEIAAPSIDGGHRALPSAKIHCEFAAKLYG